MKILIQNGHVLDPESKTEGIYDILVEGKKIVKGGRTYCRCSR